MPSHRRAVLVGHEIGYLLGRGTGPGILGPVVEVGRAVLHPLHHPGRMPQRLELGLPGELERPAPAVARVAFAVGALRHVDGEDQRAQPGIARALDHVLGDRLVLGGIELVPAVVGRELAEILDRAGAGARHDEGHVGVARRLGQHQIGAAAEQAGEAGGRDADRARIGPAEQGRRLLARRDVDQVARHDTRLAEGLLVGDQPDLVVGAALDEVIGDLGQPLLGELAQVFDVHHAIHCYLLLLGLHHFAFPQFPWPHHQCVVRLGRRCRLFGGEIRPRTAPIWALRTKRSLAGPVTSRISNTGTSRPMNELM